MANDTTIRLDKSESKLTQFVQRASSTDGARPILMGVNINNERVSAADGFRLHSTERKSIPALAAPDLQTMSENGKTFQLGKIRNAALNYIEPEEIPGHFPKVTQLIPRGKPVVRFAVNPKFLIDACKSLDKGKPVCITVYSDTSPVEIQGVIDEKPVYALLMPMRMEGHECPDLSWKPRTGEAQVVE